MSEAFKRYVAWGFLAVTYCAASAVDLAVFDQRPSLAGLTIAGLVGGWAIGNLFSMSMPPRKDPRDV